MSQANLIDTKTKRVKLPPRREPYWSSIRKGLFIGFRKLGEGEGTWIARWRNDEGKQKYNSLGHFDKYDEAVNTARAWYQNCEMGVSPKSTTVAEACRGYVADLKAEGRHATAKDAEGRFSRLIYGSSVGRLAIDKLNSRHLRDWLNNQVDADEEDDEEDVRRSKDSANRNLATFKAALNRAHKSRLVANDSAWTTVEAFEKVSARRKDAFLTLEQRIALLTACPDDLALLVKAALLTGARPGELANLNVNDFDKERGTLTLRGKTGQRTGAISTAAAQFFTEVSKDRIGNAPMLATSYGQRWNKDSWKKVFKQCATAAGLPEAVVMYSLRHTAISEMILAGMDSYIVANLTGTSVAMIEKNYGHLKHSVVTAKLDKVVML